MRKRVVSIMHYPPRYGFQRVSNSSRGHVLFIHGIRRGLHTFPHLEVFVYRVVRQEILSGVQGVRVCQLASVRFRGFYPGTLGRFSDVIVYTINYPRSQRNSNHGSLVVPPTRVGNARNRRRYRHQVRSSKGACRDVNSNVFRAFF